MLFLNLPAYAANDYSIVGGVSMNKKNVEFAPAVPAADDIEFEFSINTAEASLTSLFSDYYIRLNYDSSYDEDAEITRANHIATHKRKDYGVTIGYNISKQLSLITGYKYGLSTKELLIGEAALPSINFRKFESSVEEKGPFIGFGYTHSLFKNLSMNITLAYADMDGEHVRVKTLPAPPFIAIDTLEGSIEGTSYGISFSGPVSDNTIYTMGYRVNRYDFTGKTVFGGKISSKEDFSIISLGVLTYIN